MRFTVDSGNDVSNLRDPVKEQREYKGVILYLNGSIYEGHINNNLSNGRGRFISPDNTCYVGYFIDGKMKEKKINVVDQFNDDHAKERAQTLEEIEHKEHVEDVQNTEDRLVSVESSPENLCIFVPQIPGEIALKDGYTTYMTWLKDGHEYKGRIKNGVPEGYGIFKWANGDKYKGNWKEGNPDGNGKLFYSNGAVYEGEFVEGKKQGQGKFITSNGDVYDDTWTNDKKNGTIIISGPSKATVISKWKDDSLTKALELRVTQKKKSK